MIYILYGENSYSRHHFLTQLKTDLGILDNEATLFAGAQLTPAHLVNAVNTIPFLSPSRLVIVEGLFTRFSPRKSAVDTTPKELVQSFSNAAYPIPPTTTLVLIEEDISAQNPLFKALETVATIKLFPLFKKVELLKWIGDEVTNRGGGITPTAMNMLANLVGSDLWGLSNEIDKLLQYSRGKPIQDSHIQEVVVLAKEANIFHLVDALLQRRVAAASLLLRQLLTQGVTPSHLIAMIARQLRHLVISKDLLNQKVPEREIQHRLGLQEFAFRQLITQARTYTVPQIINAYQLLLDTDIAIKTGRREDDVALDVLVAELGKSK